MRYRGHCSCCIALPGEQDIQTLVQQEAAHIIMVLKKCNGKIYGKGGAAEIPGLPSSTLTSRVSKNRVSRKSCISGDLLNQRLSSSMLFLKKTIFACPSFLIFDKR
jgi:hypothetical protein